jgi:hypothetical protein
VKARFESTEQALHATDAASLATFMMMCSWGAGMRTFGPSPEPSGLLTRPVMETDRVEFLEAVYNTNPLAVRFKRRDREFDVLVTSSNEPGDKQGPEIRYEMGTIEGVSLVFPLMPEFADAYLSRRMSLYHLGTREEKDGLSQATFIANPDKLGDGRMTLLVDLAYHFYGLDELYELKVKREAENAVGNPNATSHFPKLLADGFKIRKEAKSLPMVFRMVWRQIRDLVRSDQQARKAKMGDAWQWPRVIVPFTGNGLGESYISNVFSRQLQLFELGEAAQKKRRDKEYFVKQDFETVDKDMVYELDWERFINGRDQWSKRMLGELDKLENLEETADSAATEEPGAPGDPEAPDR